MPVEYQDSSISFHTNSPPADTAKCLTFEQQTPLPVSHAEQDLPKSCLLRRLPSICYSGYPRFFPFLRDLLAHRFLLCGTDEVDQGVMELM